MLGAVGLDRQNGKVFGNVGMQDAPPLRHGAPRSRSSAAETAATRTQRRAERRVSCSSVPARAIHASPACRRFRRRAVLDCDFHIEDFAGEGRHETRKEEMSGKPHRLAGRSSPSLTAPPSLTSLPQVTPHFAGRQTGTARLRSSQMPYPILCGIQPPNGSCELLCTLHSASTAECPPPAPASRFQNRVEIGEPTDRGNLDKLGRPTLKVNICVPAMPLCRLRTLPIPTPRCGNSEITPPSSGGPPGPFPAHTPIVHHHHHLNGLTAGRWR